MMKSDKVAWSCKIWTLHILAAAISVVAFVFAFTTPSHCFASQFSSLATLFPVGLQGLFAKLVSGLILTSSSLSVPASSCTKVNTSGVYRFIMATDGLSFLEFLYWTSMEESHHCKTFFNRSQQRKKIEKKLFRVFHLVQLVRLLKHIVSHQVYTWCSKGLNGWE